MLEGRVGEGRNIIISWRNESDTISGRHKRDITSWRHERDIIICWKGGGGGGGGRGGRNIIICWRRGSDVICWSDVISWRHDGNIISCRRGSDVMCWCEVAGAAVTSCVGVKLQARQ